MQLEFSKILSGLIKLAVTISLVATSLVNLISFANASSFDLQSSAPANLSSKTSSVSISSAALNTATESLSDYPSGATQSVLKSTHDNEITIKLDNPPEKTVVSQNIIIASQKPSSAQQAELFRIYRSNLLKKTYQHVIYPSSAIDRDQQGDVILKLTISRDGDIQKVDYDKRAVKNAMPYPAAPKQLLGETFEVIMPIKFRLAR